MSNVIDFLERLGQDALLHDASSVEIDEALRAAGIEPRLRAAILDKDERALHFLLGADTNVCCLIHKEDEEEEEEEETEEEEDDTDGEDEDEKKLPRSQVALRDRTDRVA